MIELKNDQLVFSFPQVHAEARLTIEFQRTLRIPDDARTYPLPPGLGRFPLAHVDDHASKVSPAWLRRGGVMLPMYQSEALWLRFDAEYVGDRRAAYPFAIKVATGKQCAVSGQAWSEGLRRDPQNYMVAPKQPWLDGYVVERGVIRQFVAMPLGSGYSAEEQITGRAEHGGVQIAVYPMKREVFERRFPKRLPTDEEDGPGRTGCPMILADAGMGLAPGGKMRQEIYRDRYVLSDWDMGAGSRCFVHLCNSLVWQSMTGSHPPHPAPTAKSYSEAGLPWFDYYDDAPAVGGSKVLASLKSVLEMSDEEGDAALPENESAWPEQVVALRRGLGRGQVREGVF